MSGTNHFCRLCFDRYLPHDPITPAVAMAMDARARAVIFFPQAMAERIDAAGALHGGHRSSATSGT